MLCVVELLYIECVVFKFDDRSFVVVHIAIIWGAEDCNYNWEIRTTIPSVHFIAINLGFMCSNN